MKKMLFVMNPYSGMRRAVRYLVDIIAMFNRAGFEVTTHMTGGQGDAAEAQIPLFGFGAQLSAPCVADQGDFFHSLGVPFQNRFFFEENLEPIPLFRAAELQPSAAGRSPVTK